MEDDRFVIQEHTTPEGVHWDLMLEKDQSLMTFRLERLPGSTSSEGITATKIFDHSLRFLTYEGPVQNGIGQVRIVKQGTFHLHHHSDDQIAITLSGQTLQASFLLTHIDGAEWMLTPTSGSEPA